MIVSRWQKILSRDAWATLVLCATLVVPSSAWAQRESSIVENRDGSGTTIVKVLPDVEQEWTIYNGWAQNQVNGAVRYADGASNFLNCTPQNRTNETLSLDCRIYDQTVQQWSNTPILVTNEKTFLDGPFDNLYNSLFALPGEYTTTIEFPGFSEAFRLQILNAGQSGSGVHFLIVQTNPPVLQSFLLRNTDLAGGTTELTNFALGILTDDYCIDLDLTPVTPGGTLAGTFGARAYDGDACGATVVEDRSAAIIPSGGAGVAGTFCAYTLNEIGACVGDPGPAVGSFVCLPCAGSCRDLDTTFIALFTNATGTQYSVCSDLRVSPVAGQSCSPSCIGVKAISIGASAEAQSIDRLSSAFGPR